MRIVFADLRGKHGLVTKDTVAGGYGSRLVPFSRTTRIYGFFKERFHRLPSIQMGYAAAILRQRGHEIRWTQDQVADGDVAVILSSLVDFRREIAWAQAARRRGMRVGFIGLAASKMPELFAEHADFLVDGEPESAMQRLGAGEVLSGRVPSPPINNLDALPFPCWEGARSLRRWWKGAGPVTRPLGGGFPVLASRSCPEFCTYCPHRILSSYRFRSVGNIVDELEALYAWQKRPYVVFRDPLFTRQRDRCLELCEQIRSRGLRLRFEIETRLDDLDAALLERLHAAGLRVVTFGVESIAPETLRKAGRRIIPEEHQRAMVETCRRLGITTVAYYVFGFLQDTWDSLAATIRYSISLGATFSQYKLLTPYPGTPLWKQLQPLVYETDWEKFDGYTPTFQHPNLSAGELRFLLGAAYARFYNRPSWLTNYLRMDHNRLGRWIAGMDARSFAAHSRKEFQLMRCVC